MCLGFTLGKTSAQTRFVQVYMPDSSKPKKPVFVWAQFLQGNTETKSHTNDTGYLEIYGKGPVLIRVDYTLDSIDLYINTFGSSQYKIDAYLEKHDEQLDPVTITGTFVKKSISSNPYNIRVIGKEKILSMAAQNLADVLSNESNIQLGQDALLGTSAIMQGVGGNDIKILLNGIPFIGRLNGNIDISQIPMSNVERIEIIEGPMSVIYGSDALGGIINIITKLPAGNKTSLRINSYADVLNNVNIDANISSRITKKIPLSINGGRHFMNGRDFDITTRVLDWKPKTKYFVDIGTAIKLNKSISLQMNSNFYTEKLTDKSNAEYNLVTIYGYNSHYYTYRWDNQMQLNVKLDDNNLVQIQNAYNLYSRRKNTIKRDLVTGEEKIYRPQDQDTTNFTLFNSRGVYVFKSNSRKMDLNLGYDFTHESGNGKRIPVTNPGITDFAAFASADLHPSIYLSIQPSVRIVNNSRYGSSIIKNYGNGTNYAPIIPSLQMKYTLSKHLVFRGSYSKGYRAPSIKELYFSFVDINHNVHGNEQLIPETSNNFILSLDYRHRISREITTSFNFAIFNNNIKNKINLALQDAITNYYTYINIGRFRSQGVSTKFDFNSSKFGLNFNSTLLSVVDQVVAEDSISNQNYFNSQISLNTYYKFEKSNKKINLFSRYTSPTFGYNENLTRYRIGGYYLLDVIFANKLKTKNIGYQIGIKNILNTTTVRTTKDATGGTHESNSGNLLITPGRLLFVAINFNIN